MSTTLTGSPISSLAFSIAQEKQILAAAKIAEKEANRAWRSAEEAVEIAQGILAMSQLKAYLQGCPMQDLPTGIRPINCAALRLRLISNSISFTGSFDFPGWMDVDVGFDRFHMPVTEWRAWNKEMDARREAQKARRF